MCAALEERLEAAQRDAKEAEAYAEELEAKLAKVITAYRIEAMRRDDYSHAAFQQHLAELIRGQKDA